MTQNTAPTPPAVTGVPTPSVEADLGVPQPTERSYNHDKPFDGTSYDPDKPISGDNNVFADSVTPQAPRAAVAPRISSETKLRARVATAAVLAVTALGAIVAGHREGHHLADESRAGARIQHQDKVNQAVNDVDLSGANTRPGPLPPANP